MWRVVLEGTVQHLIHFRELDTDEHSSRTADDYYLSGGWGQYDSDNKMHLLQQINDPVLLLTAGCPACTSGFSTPWLRAARHRPESWMAFLGGIAANVKPPVSDAASPV